MQCYSVTGEADFVLIITATDMEEYEAFIKRAAVRGASRPWSSSIA
jgi:DNA-binding Lrp family transcriptional regulator